jgi:ribosome biogenesis SPOUT family RNA methylase Rps3
MPTYPTVIDKLETIPYLDFPNLKFNEHESTEMPFRYVKGTDEKPVMPEVSQCHSTYLPQ